jgi:nitrogenase molybdenum-iron protein alpha/beta subunit
MLAVVAKVLFFTKSIMVESVSLLTLAEVLALTNEIIQHTNWRFFALMWAVCDKFHEYLYGQVVHVHTDNNPLTYAFTTAKLDANSHR